MFSYKDLLAVGLVLLTKFCYWYCLQVAGVSGVSQGGLHAWGGNHALIPNVRTLSDIKEKTGAETLDLAYGSTW